MSGDSSLSVTTCDVCFREASKDAGKAVSKTAQQAKHNADKTASKVRTRTSNSGLTCLTLLCECQC